MLAFLKAAVDDASASRLAMSRAVDAGCV